MRHTHATCTPFCLPFVDNCHRVGEAQLRISVGTWLYQSQTRRDEEIDFGATFSAIFATANGSSPARTNANLPRLGSPFDYNLIKLQPQYRRRRRHQWTTTTQQTAQSSSTTYLHYMCSSFGSWIWMLWTSPLVSPLRARLEQKLLQQDRLLIGGGGLWPILVFVSQSVRQLLAVQWVFNWTLFGGLSPEIALSGMRQFGGEINIPVSATYYHNVRWRRRQVCSSRMSKLCSVGTTTTALIGLT